MDDIKVKSVEAADKAYPLTESAIPIAEYCAKRLGFEQGFEKGVEFGKQDTIEKVVAYLDSLMYYVSEQDRRLVCNFTKFDKFIEDLKKTVNQ